MLLTSRKVFFPRMVHFKGLVPQPEDLFREVSSLMDFLLYAENVNQRKVDGLWMLLINDIRSWKPDVAEEDKMLMAGTVFTMARSILCHHTESRFRDKIHDMIENTLEKKLKIIDDQEQREFLDNLSECAVKLDEWINHYDESNEWLSDEIADVINSRKDKDEDDFLPCGTTFTKTALLTDKLIDIIGQRLAQAHKLNASPDDWRKLFSGINQQFDMTWLGTEGELRDLFKMLTDKPQYIKPKRNFQLILKSHFLDEHGRRFNNLHGAKSIESFQPILDDCAFLLQHLTDSMTAIMKQLVMDNEDALREMGYFKKVQASKQAGLSIRNKRR